jgi:hypothetical protein
VLEVEVVLEILLVALLLAEEVLVVLELAEAMVQLTSEAEVEVLAEVVQVMLVDQVALA